MASMRAIAPRLLQRNVRHQAKPIIAAASRTLSNSAPTLAPPSDTWSLNTGSESEVGSAHLDWGTLGFDYVPTNGHFRHTFKEGEWDSGRLIRDPYVSVHILANVFHYGQALFEGFKVFHTKDGSVRSFFDGASHQRMAHGCRRFRMPMVSRKVWEEAIDACVRENVKYIPPYGSGGALYVRPFIFGSGPKLGLGPSPEYNFTVFVNPVGSYYAAGKIQSLDGMVNDDFDRAAPLGCGDCKAAGNYAADLESMYVAKQKGFPISLYLDAKERRYVEEFNTSNFIAITKDGKYLTPNSPRSVLDSNTNKVLRQLAADMGLQVEQRHIDFEAEVDTFAEVGAVGTAVVVTPLKSLARGDKKWNFAEEPDVLKKLHDKVRAIQQGDEEDKHNWMREIPLVDENKQAMMSIYPGL